MRQVVARQRFRLRDNVHQPRADIIILPSRRQSADLAQLRLVPRRVAGNIGQRFIAHDPPAGQVLGLGFAFAPCGQRLEPAQHFRIPALCLHAQPGFFRVIDIIVRVGELFHLGVDPDAATGLLQFLQHHRKNRR